MPIIRSLTTVAAAAASGLPLERGGSVLMVVIGPAGRLAGPITTYSTTFDFTDINYLLVIRYIIHVIINSRLKSN
jgi:hypothetical protein